MSTTEPTAATTQASEALDDVEKQVRHREWIVEGELPMARRGNDPVMVPFRGVYQQKPLSYLSMLEFTGLIGRKIEEIMAGPEGLTIDGLFGEDGILPGAVNIPGISSDAIEPEGVQSIDAFARGIAKLAAYVPDLIAQAQCIWLRIPLRDRPFVTEIWGRSADEGGLSMDDGEEMMSLFLEQNWEEILAFFTKRLPRIIAKARRKQTKTVEGPTEQELDSLDDRLQQSRPLSPTAPSTPSPSPS